MSLKTYLNGKRILTAAGHDQQFDEQFVAKWGTGLQPEEAHGFFPHLDITKYKKG